MARDNDSNLVNWNPDKNQTPGQFDLCTSCHTMYDYTGDTLLASGTAAAAATGKPATGKVGHHETSWYRIIATTHYDNPATSVAAAGTTGNVIEGYNLRKNTANPCFDCHGHEFNAGTRYGQTTTPTIYTDWAQSGHAGGLLKAKYLAGSAVDNVMISGVAATDCTVTIGSFTRVTSAGDAWAYYDCRAPSPLPTPGFLRSRSSRIRRHPISASPATPAGRAATVSRPLPGISPTCPSSTPTT